MCLVPRPICLRLLMCTALLAAAARQVCAQSLAANDAGASKSTDRTAKYRPLSPAVPGAAKEHPLTSVLKYARAEQIYLREAVHDFTCRLVKRERIDGILQDYQYIDMKVREEVRGSGRVISPLSINLHFLGPANVAGRRVIYVAGRNDGKMLVRNGGKHFDYVVVQIEPWGESAQKESLVPITESGFNQVLAHMIDVLDQHVQADPSGENTQVERLAGAKLNKRACSVIRIVHPKKQDGLDFHVANVFIDDELRVPVRVDFSDWPRRPNQPPPLLAEYTYTELQLNVNLPDATFKPAALRGNR